MTTVRLTDITVDPRVQLGSRTIDPATVQQYVEAIGSGAAFPPVVCYQENGKLWLADGFHRIRAYRFCGVRDVPAEVRDGTRQEALVWAAVANVTHGRPMSRQEKEDAGHRLLKLTGWSQHRIAKELAVGAATVSRWAAAIPNGIDERARSVQVTRNGTTYVQDTTHIGIRAAVPQAIQTPQAEAPAAPAPGVYTTPDNSRVILGDARTLNPRQFPHPYGVILADPPWPYRFVKGNGIAADHYPVMTDEAVAAMPVADLAAANCVLFLWGTWPKLPSVLQVLRAWDFDYVTGFPWIKTAGEVGPNQPVNEIAVRYGIGHWVRGCSEYILIGRRGKVPVPHLEGFLGLLSPTLHHSRKPESVHAIAETLPGPYLELFARQTRPGWTVFGNEIQGVLGDERKRLHGSG